MDTYLVRRLEQAKLLTDPFKLKLLERFAGKPATTKQVADRMGEKAPRLYRHVDALVEEGLLQLVEEKPKRGTIERYYRTVAARFEMDPQLFSTSSGGGEASDMMRRIIRDTESDLLRLLEQHDNDDKTAENELPILMRVSIRGTRSEIAGLRSKLEQWIAECGSIDAGREDSPGLVSYAGLLAFYPQSVDDT